LSGDGRDADGEAVDENGAATTGSCGDGLPPHHQDAATRSLASTLRWRCVSHRAPIRRGWRI